LKRAGIPRVDPLGRSVHFHSFRKTWQTLGVRYGINQRVAQEVLGHSDANLTAKVYTDVPALGLHAEIAKLPWIEAEAPANPITHLPIRPRTTTGADNAQRHSQKCELSNLAASLADILRQIEVLSQATGTEGLSHFVTPPGAFGRILEMAARAGIEPATK
jgi:hypothetical protein